MGPFIGGDIDKKLYQYIIFVFNVFMRWLRCNLASARWTEHQMINIIPLYSYEDRRVVYANGLMLYILFIDF